MFCEDVSKEIRNGELINGDQDCTIDQTLVKLRGVGL